MKILQIFLKTLNKKMIKFKAVRSKVNSRHNGEDPLVLRFVLRNWGGSVGGWVKAIPRIVYSN
jgi:hypothetical protein